MSELDQLVTVNITATSATPAVPNFGTPAIYGYHTHNTDLVRTYFDTAGMVSDGFALTDPLCLMAARILAQNPHPPSFKVIRATSAATQVSTFTVTDNNAGDSVGMDLLDASGNNHDCHHTVGSETLAQVATAIATLIAAVPGVASSVAAGAVITTTLTTAGKIIYPSEIFGGNYQDTTPLAATHPDADLTAARAFDDAWYTITPEHFDPNTISNVCAWAETNGKVAVWETADSDTINTSGGGGIVGTLFSANYNRDYGEYDGTPAEYGPLGLAAQRLTADPGSDSWAYKITAGRTVDSLTPTQITNLDDKNGNYNIPVDGVNVSLFGRAPSGLFIDITRGIDALSADIQTRIFNLLLSNPKVPFTQAGIAIIGGEVSAALKDSVTTGFLSAEVGFQFSVTLPNLSTDINPIDKKARVLKGIKFTAFATGAVHKVQINGTVNL